MKMRSSESSFTGGCTRSLHSPTNGIRATCISRANEYKHHIATYGPQSKVGYKDFIPMFKAEHFDASAWARLFREAGAKYVVPVAEHHDGFPIYDSNLTDWCAGKMGPKRDLLGELATAVRAEGDRKSTRLNSSHANISYAVF